MSPTFDLFKEDSNGDEQWLGVFADIETGKWKARELMASSPGVYFVYSQLTGNKFYVIREGADMTAKFLKAFPMLEGVLIESWQEGTGMGNPYTQTPPSRAYGRPHSVMNRVLDCANRNCKSGGFDILTNISAMVHDRLTTKEFAQVCCGNEASSTTLGRSCVNTLHYRLTLEYTPGQSPE